MKPKRTWSIVWKIDKTELEKIVRQSTTMKQVLHYFGLSALGGNYTTIRKRLDYDGIDHSHIKRGSGSNRGRRFVVKRRLLSEVMVKNSTYNRGHLKKRLIKDKLLKERCAICDLTTVWNRQPLVLRLDHINGVNNDHRLSNLRLLCPNCDSQTSTFAGRNNKKADSSNG